MSLKGKKALITGANRGFGLALAKAFAAEGADLWLAARDLALLEKEAAALRATALSSQQICTAFLDLENEASIVEFVSQVDHSWGSLDVLVNNAGIYGPKGKLDELAWKDWTAALQVNLMGPVRLCQLALPLLKRSRGARIINLSGGGATAPMPRLSAYAASKAAWVRFTETMAEELRDEGIAVNAVAPGAMNTRMLDEILEAGADKVGHAYHARALEQKAAGGVPPAEGAALCVFLAGPEGAGITGKLISAVWDPWRRFGSLKEKLDGSDVYTLRRILPKDRGMDF